MAERLISNLREKLSKSREMCPGLSEEVYALADYMAMLTDTDPTAVSEPRDTAFILFMCLGNIMSGYSGSVVPDIDEFPEYFITHKEQVLKQAVNILYVFEAITDEDFASELCEICKNMFEAIEEGRKKHKSPLIIYRDFRHM